MRFGFVKFFRNSSIHRKLLLSLSFLVVIPLFILGILSYRGSSRVISEKTTELYEQALSQTVENYRIIFDEIESISLFLLANDDVRDLLNETRSVPEFFRARGKLDLTVTNHFKKTYILSLAISSNDRSISYQVGTSVISEDANIWYKMAEETRGEPVWSSIHDIVNILDGSTVKVVSLYRQVIDLDKNIPIGMIRISMSEDAIYNLYKNLIVDDGTITYIVDKNGKMVSHSNKALLGNLVPDREILIALQEGKQFLTRKISGNRYAIIKKVPGYNYTIVKIIPYESIFYDSFFIRNLILFTMTGCLIFGLTIGYILTCNITKPINLLTEKMNEVENGNFDVSVDIRAKDEMGRLSHHFNNMVLKIKTLIRDLYEVRLKEREAELKALQEQINPHFLYNTLDTIRWTARKNGDFESGEYIEILSDLLRQNLNNGKYYTSIGREVANLKNYIFLQKKRYGDRLRIVVNIDEDLYSYKIIKLVLQPLVENAINYGIAPVSEKALITISAEYQNDMITIKVIDNGLGVDDGVINEIIHSQEDTKRVYALKNINERIKYHFGEKYGLSFKSILNEGTKATVIIPAIIYQTDISKEVAVHEDTDSR